MVDEWYAMCSWGGWCYWRVFTMDPRIGLQTTLDQTAGWDNTTWSNKLAANMAGSISRLGRSSRRSAGLDSQNWSMTMATSRTRDPTPQMVRALVMGAISTPKPGIVQCSTDCPLAIEGVRRVLATYRDAALVDCTSYLHGLDSQCATTEDRNPGAPRCRWTSHSRGEQRSGE